tara:strand:- start:1190 stop:1378 length:189 start_codon:yes stop_codon:yes gene_type:complete
MNFVSTWVRLKSFAGECVRVIKVTKKPDAMEFKTIVKVSGLGMIIIGIIGFFMFMGRQMLFP